MEILGQFSAEIDTLDHAGPQPPLALVVRGLDLAGKIAERQQLIAGAGDLGQKVTCQRTRRRRAENGFEITLQRAAFGAQSRDGETLDVARQGEDAIRKRDQMAASGYAAMA